MTSLLKRYEGKVKCIYIDPPYNTGSDSFNYNDSFNHSTWLTFMKNRLELAKKLLKDDGVIFVQCDDNEQAYLKVLMDDIFGRKKYYGSIIQLKGSTQNDSKTIQKNHEYILCYVKELKDLLLTYKNYVKKEVFEDKYYLGRDTGSSSGHDKLIDRNNLGYTIYYYEGNGNGITGNNNRLIDRNNLGYTMYNIFKKGDKILHAIALKDYDIANLHEDSTEEEIYTNDEYLISLGYVPIRPPKRVGEKLGCWTWSIENFKELWNQDSVLIKNNKNIIKKEFVSENEIKKINNKNYYIKENILPVKSIVDISSSKGTTHLQCLFGKKIFSNPKSEELLNYLIEISTKEKDIVLDFHLGSGTTAAVAHKMGRRYIGVEQMDYIEDIAIERLKKVIEGEQGGISKAVNWQGGGSFVYCELMENGNELIREIENVDENTIKDVKAKIYKDERIIPYITTEELEKVDKDFEELSLEDKKKVLIKLIDKNKLYVNYSDIGNEDFNISEADKKFTESFYEVK